MNKRHYPRKKLLNNNSFQLFIMQRIHFSTTINAPKEKVWNALWDLHHYQTWTNAFAEGSTVETDNWKEGSRLCFGDGYGSGMISEVVINKPNEYMSFRHLGFVKDGVEDTSSEKVAGWAGAMENYSLKEANGVTEVEIETDITDDFKDYMMKVWPVALTTLKGLAEGTVKPVITVTAEINSPVEKVWKVWTSAEDMIHWNSASNDWHCPAATNDFKPGGKLTATMAAKDGSFSFDFWAIYDEIKEKEYIHASMGDGRIWKTLFKDQDGKTIITEKFEAETENPLDMQQAGWQAILNNFKKYCETK